MSITSGGDGGGGAIYSLQDVDLHMHCLACVRVHCTDSTGTVACPVVACINSACTAHMHACKMDDHLMHVCQYTVVECLNTFYGCE